MTYHLHDNVLYFRPSRPAKPTIAAALVQEVCELATLVAERTAPLAAVVLDGGEGFFVEPTDAAETLDALADAGWSAATKAVAGIDAPTIAVIRSRATGPAWELALACDLRVAHGSAIVGSPEVARGRMPQAGGTQRLVRIAGVPTALDLLLTGRLLTGHEALELGLVHRAVDSETQLESTLEDLITSMRAAAPIALGYAKEAVRASELPLDDGLRLEADLTSILQTTLDRSEGLAAFRQKRPPSFTGS